MPLDVRRLYTSVLLVLFGFTILASGQTPPQTTAQVIPPPVAPTSGDVMRDRISKAKAYIAVRNYAAATYELENIRRETNDTALKGVVNVLLMNSYLEQGDFTRAQSFLTQFFNEQKTNRPNASAAYMAVAGQIVKGARGRVERYRALGLNVSDRTLPLEATNDLEKMRETLELVITQSKEIGKDKVKTPDAMALLEEASTSRSMLARDDYDARRWSEEMADTREGLANPGQTVADATNGTTIGDPNGGTVAANTKPLAKPPVTTPPVSTPAVNSSQNIPSNQTVAANDKPSYVPLPAPTPAVKEEPKKDEAKKEVPIIQTPNAALVNDGSPVDVGSALVAYATSKSPPVYPTQAKTTRTTGVVRVDVTVSETGEVAQVQKTTGPMLLQAAAKDAIKRWKFKPFLRDGQPVKATGFVSFNFAL